MCEVGTQDLIVIAELKNAWLAPGINSCAGGEKGQSPSLHTAPGQDGLPCSAAH